MYKILSESERSDLIVRHKVERDKRIADRIKAVLLYDDGWTPPKIASALFIDENTVRDHLKLYQEDKGSHAASSGVTASVNGRGIPILKRSPGSHDLSEDQGYPGLCSGHVSQAHGDFHAV